MPEEQRIITVLVADLRGYTAFTHERGDEAAGQLTSRFAELARQALSAHGGRLIETRGDDVLAFFTSARQALRAAVALQARCLAEATDNFPLRVGIGLDAGEPVWTEAGYRGESLNIAARLCALAAPGEVLVTQGVAHLARRVEGIVVEERGSESLKGLPAPIRLAAVRPSSQHEVDAAMPLAPPLLAALPEGSYLGALPRGGLVGRDAELSRILGALDSAAARRGRFVLLSGEPGVGKTRLLQESLLHAGYRGFWVLTARCSRQHIYVPRHPISTALAGLLRDSDHPYFAGAIKRWQELHQLKQGFHADQLDTDDQDNAQLRLALAVSDLLRSLATDTPVVLVLDDLQWADSVSLDLLQHLARRLRGERVLLLGAYRDQSRESPAPLGTLLDSVRRARLLDEVVLRGLLPAGTNTLIRIRLNTTGGLEDLTRVLHQRSDGNPLHVEELLESLLDRDATDVGDVRPDVIAGAQDLPSGIDALILRRARRLGQGAQDVLSAVSVLGDEFDLQTARAVAGQSEAAFLANLAACVAVHLLEARPSGGGGDERYGFSHALVQQSLEEALPAQARRRLHLRALEALEPFTSGIPRAAAELARHALAAGHSERAVTYARVSGDFAASAGAHFEAARQFEDAIRLIDATGNAQRAAEVRRKLGASLAELGRVDEADAVFRTALATYKRLGAVAGQAVVQQDLGFAYVRNFDFAHADQHLSAALGAWPKDQEDAGLVRLLLSTAGAKVFVHEQAAAGGLAEHGLVLAERLASAPLLLWALNETAFVQCAMGAPADEVYPRLDRAVSFAESLEDWKALARAATIRAQRKWLDGDLAGSREDRRRGLAAVERSAAMSHIGLAGFNLATVCLHLGAWEEGRVAAQHDQSEDGERSSLSAWFEGDFDGALAGIRHRVATLRAEHNAPLLVQHVSLAADMALELGYVAEAEGLAREGTALVRSLGYWGLVSLPLGPLAEVLVRMRSPDAESVLAEAFHLVDRYGQRLAIPQLLRARGLLMGQRDDRDKARAALLESAGMARTQSALPQLGRTLAEVAVLARALGDEALGAIVAAEHDEVTQKIGPEAGGLPWAARAAT